MMSRRRSRRGGLALAVGLLLVASASTVQVARAAFTATTTNGTNAFSAASSFPDYPTTVKADNPLFYHRLDDAAGSTTAVDSSANGLTGVYGADQATGAAFLAPFDEGSGSAADDLSGVATPHDLTGTNLTWQPGRSGSSGSFNGTSAYSAASGSVVNTSTSFTVAAWVYLTDNTAYRTAVSQDGTTVAGFQLQYNLWQNRWVMNMQASDTTSPAGNLAISTTVPVMNTWTHLVGSYDAAADKMSIYVNGILEGTNTWAGAWNATSNLVVGAEKYNGIRDGFFQGRVDDVRLFSSVLSQGQVTELYAGISAGPSTRWDFSENAGTTTTDLSGNGYTGTFGSGSTWTTGKNGAGVAVNGTANGSVDAGAAVLDTTKSFTVSAWLYLTDKTVLRTAMAQEGTSVSPFYLQVTSGASAKWNWTMFDTDSSSSSGVQIPSTGNAALSTWTHVVGVYDTTAAQALLYVNGVLQGTAAHTTSWNAAGHLVLGHGRLGGSSVDFFAGRIDEVRTYRRALSAAEISTLYNTGTGNAVSLGHTSLGQPGALQGAQQGQRNSTSAGYSNAGNGYNPTRYSSPATFSIECWFASPTAGGTILDFGSSADGNAGTYGRRIQLSATGVVSFGTNSGITNIISSSASYLDGNWHHVVATAISTGNIALYLDGALVGSITYPGTQLVNGVWRWGGETHNASWPSPDDFTGRIDEVAVYGNVLTAQQVAWHYYANH